MLEVSPFECELGDSLPCFCLCGLFVHWLPSKSDQMASSLTFLTSRKTKTPAPSVRCRLSLQAERTVAVTVPLACLLLPSLKGPLPSACHLCSAPDVLLIPGPAELSSPHLRTCCPRHRRPLTFSLSVFCCPFLDPFPDSSASIFNRG